MVHGQCHSDTVKYNLLAIHVYQAFEINYMQNISLLYILGMQNMETV